MADGEPSRARRVRRRRQELRRVENDDARHVTFSKRRKGLFKKASELATLCGAEVGILVNSPAGRPYTFGSPAIEPIMNRFLSNKPNQAVQNHNENLFQRALNHMNKQYSGLESRLDAANFRRVLLNDRLNWAANAAPECQWSENIDGLQMDKLRCLFDTLCQIKARLLARHNELIQAGGISSFNANVAKYQGPLPQGLIIGNNLSAEKSLRTDSHLVQINQTMVAPPESTTTNSISPSLNVHSGAGLDLGLVPSTRPIAGFYPSFGGVRSPTVVKSTEERVPSMINGFRFGSSSSNQNTDAGNSRNTEFFMNPVGYGQSFGTKNPYILFNFNPNSFLPNPLEGANNRSNPIESDSLAGLFGPYSSSSLSQLWPAGCLGENLLRGLDSGAHIFARASTGNSGMNHLILRPGQDSVGVVDSDVQYHASRDNTGMNHFVLGSGQNMVSGINLGAQDQAGESTTNTDMNHIILAPSVSDTDPKEVDSEPASSKQGSE